MSQYEFLIHPGIPHIGGNIWQGDPLTYSPTVWRYMIDRFAVKSVLDVGSGRGHAAAWFHRAGCAVVALDGSHANVMRALHPTIHHDLTFGPMTCRVDLVHCQEVAEHVAEEHVNNLTRTLANGETIIMSHGEPGQAGHHHVNLQPSDYWIERMVGLGFCYLDIDTARVREYASKDGADHLARSGLVFARAMG